MSYVPLFIGLIMTLIGFKFYKPFKEEYYNRFSLFYKIGGILLVMLSLINILLLWISGDSLLL